MSPSVAGKAKTPLWSFGIIVEGLRESLIDRRLVGASVEKCPGSQDMEALGKPGLHRPRPVIISGAGGGNAGVVVVGEVLDGRRVKVRDPEGGQHIAFP